MNINNLINDPVFVMVGIGGLIFLTFIYLLVKKYS